MHKYVKLQIGVKWINIHLEKRKGFKGGKDRKQSWQIRFFHQQFYLSKNTWWEKSMSKSRMSISALWLMKIRKKDKMYMIKSNNFSQELEKPFPRPSSDVSLILDSKFHLSFRKWRNNRRWRSDYLITFTSPFLLSFTMLEGVWGLCSWRRLQQT